MFKHKVLEDFLWFKEGQDKVCSESFLTGEDFNNFLPLLIRNSVCFYTKEQDLNIVLKNQLDKEIINLDMVSHSPYQNILLCIEARDNNHRDAILILRDEKKNNINMFFFTRSQHFKRMIITPGMFHATKNDPYLKYSIIFNPNAGNHIRKSIDEYEKGMMSENPYDSYLITQVIAFLSILNCKNIETETHPAPERLNKKRKKNNKPLISEYKTLVIKPTSKKQKSRELQGLWENRLHLCRGHFKDYTEERPLFGRHTGRYWWQPSIKGNKELGTIHKDYKIET